MPYLGFISPETQFYDLPGALPLETGGSLLSPRLAYRTWGSLNAAGDNAIVICHALTGSADADDWWQPLFGAGHVFDPERDFVMCSNVLGSCYGSTGATSLNPATGSRYGPDFPPLTIRDMVRAQASLVKALGVQRVQMVVGGSLGGMQVLEWGVLYPEWVEKLVVIAASGRHSAWCIALSEAQRQAIYTDPLWQGGYYALDHQPAAGLATARMIAMTTYRSYASFQQRYGRNTQLELKSVSLLPSAFAITDYLHYQGRKLVERFDANTYIDLTEAMDRHDLATGRERYEAVLAGIPQQTLIVAIDSDILYPPQEQEELTAGIPQARLAWLHSLHGHDAFLIDMTALGQLILAHKNA